MWHLSPSFFGGVHPDDGKKLSSGSAIEQLPPPERVVIPLSMHIGAECTPVVAKGDRVLLGQLIGESQANVSAPIHSSVSGTVAAVEPRLHPNGKNVLSVVIDNDGEDTWHESVVSHEEEVNQSPQAVLDIVKASGIVGMAAQPSPPTLKYPAL